MKQKTGIHKLLNIQVGEGKAVLLLMIYSFFMGLSLAFFFTSTNAIFLTYFEPKMIPVSFIASGVAVYLAWLLLSLIDKRLSVSNQLVVKLLFITVSVVFISVAESIAETGWLAFFMFTWVRVIVYISLVTFWGVAAKLFNIRQGKRIFGLISTGEVISLIIGYFSIPLLLGFMKTTDLLFLAAFSLIVCVVVVILIIKNFKDKLEPVKQNPTEKAVINEEKTSWKYLDLIKKPYFLYISLMALLPIFGYLFIDFKFLYQTKFEFNNDQQLVARFLGIFLGFVALFEFVLKIFVSGKLLTKYGLKPSLLSLPVALIFSIVMAAFLGTIYGPVGLFFVFIVFARLLERSFRGAIYDPAFQILFQPIPANQRLAFQSQIEGIPKAAGTVIVGVFILILTSFSFLNLVHYCYIFIIILIIWIRITLRMYQEYRNRLKHLLAEAPENAKIPTQKQNEKNQLISSQNLIDSFIQNKDVKAIDKQLISIEEDISEAENISLEQLEKLSKSKSEKTREKAARLLGYSGRYKAFSVLTGLLQDKNVEVKKAAIISSGKIKRIELWPHIIENLSSSTYANTAEAAIKLIGKPILNELEKYFWKVSENKNTQLRIIRLIASIGGENAKKLLKNKMNIPDKDLRYQILLFLSLLEYHVSQNEVAVIKDAIQNVTNNTVWIMASLVDIGEDDETKKLYCALQYELSEKKEQIFLLLSLLYDSKTMKHIRENIEAGNNQTKVYALEICDMTVSQDIKELFLPLFEDMTLHDRIHKFGFHYPQEKLSRLNRIKDIINKDYTEVNRWTKACAIELLKNYDSDEISEIAAANIVNPDPLLSEGAAWVLFNKNQDRYFDTVIKFEKKDILKLKSLTKNLNERTKNNYILIAEKINILKNTELFKETSEINLIDLAINSIEVILNKNEEFSVHNENKNFVFLMVDGQIDIQKNDKTKKSLFVNDYFGSILETKNSKDNWIYQTSKKTKLLGLDINDVFSLCPKNKYFGELSQKT
jgi:hypothetical protein